VPRQFCQTPEPVIVGEDYRMIVSLDITNFRGFRNVSLAGLPKFNVLIGESGSGKTAFLEALWIQCAQSPEIYFRMRAFRGMLEQQYQIAGERITYEAFFSDLFQNPGIESGAQIQIIDSESGFRQLIISYAGPTQLTMKLDQPQITANPGVRPIQFLWRVGNQEYPCPLKIVNNQIVADTPPPPYLGVYFASSFLASAKETAERLSLLSIRGEKQKIIDTLKSIYSDIVDLSSEGISGQQMVWAGLKGIPNKIPLAVVSSGINKLAGMILWAALNRGGVLLVDEIDNGFYFADYEMVFQTIVKFCDDYNVQLFASTHNKEFLRAIAKLMGQRDHDLAMLRTKFRDGNCLISQIKGVSSIEAINQDIEIRL
jgi:hypothetical protein